MIRIRFGLLLLAALSLGACDDDTTGSGADPPTQGDLACSQFGYPCSLSDTAPERLEAAIALLDQAWAQRHAGSMADARAWLEAQPDVMEVLGDDRAVRFRVANCPPVWLTDTTGLTDAPPTPGDDRAIVGDDTNDDAVIDNRDAKRALVLAPYLWSLQPHDDSGQVAEELADLRGYAEHVFSRSNPDTNDQNIDLDDYLHWDDHDVVFLSTHGGRIHDFENDRSWAVVATGVFWKQFDPPPVSPPGAVLLGIYNGDPTRRVLQLGLTGDFFRATYPDGLDDTVVVLAACEAGGEQGSSLAEAMAGDRFVLFGWTEPVAADDAFAATSLLMEQLGEGRRGDAALDAVGLRSVLNPDLDTTVLERFAPDGGDQRLFELPQLLDDQGDVLVDGVDLSPRVIGTVGDGAPDGLALIVELDGVDVDDRDEFVLHYRYDGDDLPGAFDLTGAAATGAFRYRAEHEVDLGRDVEAVGGVPVEVVVDLPEGGQSRFRVDVEFKEPAGGVVHECDEYVPTPAGGDQSGDWPDPEASGSAACSGPPDPGGGYWTVTASCDAPVNVRLIVRSGDGPGTIFSESNQGTESPQSITAIFEAAPGWSYAVEAHQAVATDPQDYPVGWSLAWNFTSLVDCYEPNQNSTQAKQLPVDIDNVTAFMVGGHRGNSLDSDDYADWYKLVVTEPSQLEVDLIQSPDDIRIRLRLWGLNDNQLAAAGGGSPGDLATLTYQAQPGTYFLSVEAAAIGDGAVNTLFDELPDHLATPYRMNVSTEPLR
jgi:hypothetical protein